MTQHLEGSEERSASLLDMMELLGFDVYGSAPGGAIDQLRRETAAVPGGQLTLLPESMGGYLRAPVRGAPVPRVAPGRVESAKDVVASGSGRLKP